MKVAAQEIEQRQVVLEIEVEDERMQRALDQAYKRIVNRINVPGFRRGRAPRPLVERMVGREAILEDAVEHLVTEAYRDALKEQNITPSGQPSVEVTSTEPLHFKATVPLEPKVELGDYRSIDVPLDDVSVEDAEIDAVLENLRESNVTWSPVERAVQIGDRVGLDAVATRADRTVMNSTDAEFIVNPDGPEPAPGFSQQIVGMQAGEERSFTLTFGRARETAESSEESPESSDETAPSTDFTVKLNWVKEKQLPELDDEFARTVGEKETVEELRAEIAEQIRLRKDYQAREKHREAVIQAVVDQATVEAPPQTIERQAQALLESMASSLDKQGITIEQYLQFAGKDEATFRSELLAEGERSLRRSVVLEAVAEAEDLRVSEDEVRAEIERAAQTATDPARTARQAFARPETRARIAGILRTRRAIDRLIALAGGSAEESASSATAVSEPTGEVNV